MNARAIQPFARTSIRFSIFSSSAFQALCKKLAFLHRTQRNLRFYELSAFLLNSNNTVNRVYLLQIVHKLLIGKIKKPLKAEIRKGRRQISDSVELKCFTEWSWVFTWAVILILFNDVSLHWFQPRLKLADKWKQGS